MKKEVIGGSKWEEEGKGKIVDWISVEAEVGGSVQGGANEGHK